MYSLSKLSFGIGLSSLAIAASLVGATAIATAILPQSAIAQSGAGNVGGALAKKLHGKPVVVEIYASWCPACKNVAPTVSQLKKNYFGKANFVVLDVSDRSKAAQSQKTAQELGLSSFFATNKSQTGLIAIIEPKTGNILAQHRNNPNVEDYSSVLNAAIYR